MTGSHHCFSCGGEGSKLHGDETTPRTCGICLGKGSWTKADIRRWHEANPEACLASCGAEHRDPWVPGDPGLEPGEVDRTIHEVEALLESLKAP